MTQAERQRTLWNRKANPDRGMQECFWDARRSLHFAKTLAADVKSHKRRSAAAKKAWKARRQAA
jgi:hypothetical protein